MKVSLRQFIYNALCACCALAIASFAMTPVSAATARAIGMRGGQSCGCHDADTHCSGVGSCSAANATACFSGAHDTNGESCSPDTGLCGDQGCGGVDSLCGGR
jgi:hypothetical protein